ncbi:MAG: PF20097 family protein [Ruminococcus sp.]
MSELGFRNCPVCGGELDTGKVKFPAPHSITERFEAEAKFYSDKTSKKYKNHPVKKLFQSYDKSFTIQTFGRADNPAGYCRKCNRIFLEFEVTD